MKTGKNSLKVWDLLLILLLSILLILNIYFFHENILRKVLGLLFILIFPGYSLISFFFPERGDLDEIKRVALSLGLSLVVSSLIGLILNYTPFGIRLTPILTSLASFNIVFSLLAAYKRVKVKNPFIPNVRVRINWGKTSRLNRVLNIFLVISIIIAFSSIAYAIGVTKEGEKFTEFYIQPKNKDAGYPTNLIVGEKAEVIIGIINHEGRTINYTVEVWLVNITYNHKPHIHNMFFIDSFSATLNHTDFDKEKWKSQFEAPYVFSINKPGKFKLLFLLFKNNVPPLPSKEKMRDYAGTEAEKRILDAINGKIQSLYLNLIVIKV